MEFDPVVLSRVQFALNISFHILFPTITIGLAYFLFFFRVRFTLSKNQVWEDLYAFWVKVFALSFALGVVTGIVMSFQFGTNWPGFMEKTGNIAGPLLGYEVLTAFFLEASFLGIMLFGRKRVSNTVHLLATAMVMVGTTLSAFWILSLNSWMQTPTGYRIEDGVMIASDWWQVIFNPSFPYRLAHMLVASMLTASFLIAGISAWRLMRHSSDTAGRVGIKVSIICAALLTPTQIFIGDLHGLNTAKYQPAKVAAMEAVWDTQTGADLTLFGIVDEQARETRYAIKIPKAASLILTHDLEGEVKGLNEFIGEHPPVAPVFWSFRVMVGIGLLMLLSAWCGAWQIFRRGLVNSLTLKVFHLMTFSGWIAVLAGWYVTEIGRQPWIVYGLIKVEDVVATHPPNTLLTTLIAYGSLYAFLLVSYISALYLMAGSYSKNLKYSHHVEENLQLDAGKIGAKDV